jgi:integrase/recombinase XerD
MTPIQIEARDYLEWMEIHNYARTTIECRGRYLDYFIAFACKHDVDEAKEVTLELILSYQHELFSHRKRDGQPLSFGTQAQRLIPVAQFFSWLRREHRIEAEPCRRSAHATPRSAPARGHLERHRDGRAP